MMNDIKMFFLILLFYFLLLVLSACGLAIPVTVIMNEAEGVGGENGSRRCESMTLRLSYPCKIVGS